MAEEENTSLLAWYDACRPMHIDLVGDYAGKELFLMDGDSLLRASFEDSRIDFHGGFQLLHAVYVVENFLDNLIKRHCQFHIAFFDEHRELCVPPGVPVKHRSRYMLARTVIIRHLLLHLSEAHAHIQVHNFPSLRSDSFDQYLDTAPIQFVMAHDGALPTTGKVEAQSDADTRAKILLRANIWWYNTHRLNVSLINRIDFVDSKVFTMILEGWFDPASVKLFETEVTETWGLVIQKDASKTTSNGTSNAGAWLSKTPIESILSGDDVASETFVLSACTIAAILSEYEAASPLASAFILHNVLIDHLTLTQRRFPLITFEKTFEDEIEKFLEQYSAIATNILADRSWVESMRDNEVDYDLVDAVDGRLFRVVAKMMLNGSLETLLPNVVKEEWKVAISLVESLSGKSVSSSASSESLSETQQEQLPVTDDVGEIGVMSFSNPVFDKHLDCVNVEVEASLPARMAALKIYRETSHWHNYRKPLNPKQAPEVKVSKWRNPLRTNQFYMAEMTSYAASLTGAKGKALEPETITVGAKKLAKEATEVNPVKGAKHEKPVKPGKTPKADDAPSNAKKGGKKAAAGLTKAQQIIADNKEKKGGAEVDKAFSSWIGVMKTFDEIVNDQDRYLKAKAYLDALDTSKATHVEADINLYLLQSLLARWSKYCKLEKKTDGYHSAALAWTVVRSICTSKAPISKDVATHVEKVCKLLSITDAMDGMGSPSLDKKLSFTFQYPAVPNLGIGIPQAEFQLLYCGPYMDRYLDARYDPRVSFTPDGWQRKVLDELDADNSVFVVAPTSAGKTFISFYAMEQVLRGDNDGVLVYVAPTKALVNQIAAEVQGRFSKKYPQAGKSVWAIHTRDYRVNNSTGCQILVTVPHVLQIMLLSSSNAKSWAPRVRRIIFDEIHSIGQEEDGIVWEQLLLLAPCPIIALSATIGNPEQFSEWLAETQKASGNKLTMIQHSTRYSDLRKYLYQSPERFQFQGLGKSHGVGLGLDGLSGLTYFHPIASLVDKSRGMPDDLALEPRDCFLLWKVMTKLQKPGYEIASSLDPAKSLPVCIKKADIFKWEKKLKEVLVKWMVDSESPFDKVISELSPPKSASSANGQVTKQIQPNPSTSEDGEDNDDSEGEEGSSPGKKVDPTDLNSTTLPLLLQLHQRQALPAILFNYDRSGCEDIGQHLLKQLKSAEDKFKEGKEWQRKLDGWTQWKEMKDKKSKKPVKASKSKGGDDDEKTSKADQARDDASGEVSSYDLFDPEEPQDNFSFADKRRCQQSELVETIRQLRRKYIPENLIQLLQRGIGIHHAGMNRKYRQCIEMLFRKGYLRVIVATGTLSLGINMPCATVVFSGDSVFLTALNFRQAAGRSGRRGFDLLGNVVFQGITTERASRLLSSRLPDLTGHFPVTTTLVLRLFTLLYDSKNSPYAVKAINSLLSQPRLYLGGESFKEQVLHHLRFSIEYLRRQSLLGPAGEPVNWTSCVSHLYFTENASFAFHALLKDGYFNTLCADIDTKTDHVLRQIMLTLSHLFGRRVCRETDDEKMAEKIRRSPSIVYLPPMPEDAVSILRKHNATTLSIFTTYVKTFAAQHIKAEEQCLPLTKIPVGYATPELSNGSAGKANGSAHANSRNISFLPTLPTPHARSPFVALSGHGDGFTTIEDLCTSTRSGVFLESAVIPHLELHPEESRTPLNAYLLDFFTHGTVQPLEEANGIRRSDVWFVLNDFSLVLATIVTSMANYLGLGKKGENEDLLDVMGSGDVAENDKDEEEAAAAIPVPANVAAIQTQAPLLRKGKKNVAEDWESDEDKTVEREKSGVAVGSGVAENDDEEYDKLMNVYRAFAKLKKEFDLKFKEIWA